MIEYIGNTPLFVRFSWEDPCANCSIIVGALSASHDDPYEILLNLCSIVAQIGSGGNKFLPKCIPESKRASQTVPAKPNGNETNCGKIVEGCRVSDSFSLLLSFFPYAG